MPSLSDVPFVLKLGRLHRSPKVSPQVKRWECGVPWSCETNMLCAMELEASDPNPECKFLQFFKLVMWVRFSVDLNHVCLNIGKPCLDFQIFCMNFMSSL